MTWRSQSSGRAISHGDHQTLPLGNLPRLHRGHRFPFHELVGGATDSLDQRLRHAGLMAAKLHRQLLQRRRVALMQVRVLPFGLQSALAALQSLIDCVELLRSLSLIISGCNFFCKHEQYNLSRISIGIHGLGHGCIKSIIPIDTDHFCNQRSSDYTNAFAIMTWLIVANSNCTALSTIHTTSSQDPALPKQEEGVG
ncbi:MAG: hypothetical protein JWN38_1014 [Candidatus Saccharibacteria bacterium]|nr:hypothetical protein [Candidatus Saccharibacteria bacterium]